MKQEQTDVLIIGAGPSGCVSAAYLHKQGVAVRVVEKTRFPRLVVGESLIPRVMDHFEEAGFLPALEAHKYVSSIFLRNIPKVGTGHGRCLVRILTMSWHRKWCAKECLWPSRQK